jgi:hypothetical protein
MFLTPANVGHQPSSHPSNVALDPSLQSALERQESDRVIWGVHSIGGSPPQRSTNLYGGRSNRGPVTGQRLIFHEESRRAQANTGFSHVRWIDCNSRGVRGFFYRRFYFSIQPVGRAWTKTGSYSLSVHHGPGVDRLHWRVALLSTRVSPGRECGVRQFR